MSNGAMFGDVVEFTDEAYFTAHETGTLYLPEETRSITIFACVEAEATDRRIYGYIAEPSTTGQMQELLSYVKEHAVQYRDIRVTGEGFRCCPVHLCGVCHKRKGGVIRKIGEGF